MIKLQLPDRIAKTIDEFTGRTWLLPVILEWLEHSSERVFLITGGPGTGKSSLMAWLAGTGPLPADEVAQSQLERIRAQVNAAHFCVATSRNLSPQAFADSVANQLTGTVKGFGDALAASLGTLVQVSQQVGQVASGGNVTGVYIARLDLGTLGDEACFDRAISQPLKKLYERGYDQPILFLVDSLDESETYTGVKKLPELLAGLDDMPAQVRIIATTRPDPRILKYYRRNLTLDQIIKDAPPDVDNVQVHALGCLARLDLIKDAPPDKDDIRVYVLNRLARVENLDADRAAAFADRMAGAAKGIFLYAAIVLDELLPRLPELSDLDLADYPLPDGLSGLYHDFLNRELGRDEDRWYETFKPVLGLIAVAQGDGLTSEQLQQITGKDVERTLRICRQYLSGELPHGPFLPFHKSLADFLLEDPDNEDYHVDGITMHRRIADWYYQHYASQWAMCDDYSLQHLAMHLYQGEQFDKLAALISQEWMWSRFKGGGYTYGGFLADVDIAWRAAEQMDTSAAQARQRLRYIGTAVRCALCQASINTLAWNTLPELVIAAVRTNVWKPARGIAFARQMTDYQQRVRALAGLVDYLNEPLQDQVREETIQTLEMIKDEFARSRILVKLLPQLSNTFLPKALAVAQRFQGGQYRTEALVGLASFLSKPLRTDALMSARAISDGRWRAEALTKLVPYLPKSLQGAVLQEAICTAQALTDEHSIRTSALIALATQSAKLGYLKTALVSAEKIEDETRQAEVFVNLMPNLSIQLLEEMVSATQKITDNEKQSKVLAKLVPRLAELGALAESLAIAGTIKIEQFRALALADLVPYLPEPLLEKVLFISRDLNNSYESAYVQTIVATRLGELGRTINAFSLVQEIQNESWQSLALSRLAPYISIELSHTAMSIARSIQNTWCRVQALIAMVPYLQEPVQTQVLDGIWALIPLIDAESQARTLIESVPQMSIPLKERFLHEALRATQAIQHDYEQARMLIDLAPELSESLLREAITAAKTIGDTRWREYALEYLLPRLAELGFPSESLSLVQQLDREHQGQALIRLAPHISDALFDQALAIANKIGNPGWRAQVLARLISQRETLNRTEKDMSTENSTAQMLASLIILAKSGHFEEAFTIAQELDDWHEKALSFATLAPYLPEPLLQKALAIAQAMGRTKTGLNQSGYGASALKGLAPYLSASLVQKALVRVQAIKDETYRVLLLARLASHLPEPLQDQVLHEVLAITRSIEDENYRAGLLGILAPLLSRPLAQEAMAITQTISAENIRAWALAGMAPSDLIERSYWISQLGPTNGLAPRLAELGYFDEAITAAYTIKNNAIRAWTLAGLAFHLTEPLKGQVLREAIVIGQVIADLREWAALLSELVKSLSETPLRDAIAAAQSIENEETQSAAMAGLLSRLAGLGHPEEALALVRETKTEWAQAVALAKLGPFLSKPLLEPALEIVQAMKRDWDRVKALAELVPYLPDPRKSQIMADLLDTAQTHNTSLDVRKMALAGLAPLVSHLTEPLRQEVLTTGCDLGPEVVSMLVPYLQEPLREEILREMLVKAEGLDNVPLIPHLPQSLKLQTLQKILPKALEADGSTRVWALTHISQQLSDLPSGDLFPLWREALRTLGTQTRHDLTIALETLVPVILALGEPAAISESAQAVIDVGRWWP